MPRDSGNSPIKGMESVVATVSGFHGSERFNLIKLISVAGASYVGAMSKSTTHLVCWKFEGRKYELSKKCKALVVNHRWVEDCIKQGKRVSENLYMRQSGEEVGPLLLEGLIPANVDASTKKQKVLNDETNVDSGRKAFDIEVGTSGSSVWTRSLLLDENFLPEIEVLSRSSRKRNSKSAGKALEGKNLSTRGDSSEDVPLTRLVGKKLANKARNLLDTSDTTLAESSCEGQRLVKKTVDIFFFESDLSNSDQDVYPLRVHKQDDKVTDMLNNSFNERNVRISRTGGTSRADSLSQRVVIEEDIEDVEEIIVLNQPPALKVSNVPEKHELLVSSRTQKGGLEPQNASGESPCVHQNERSLPTSLELSCVICWTEFSSTRGVLPCGHRFCYSCIKDWADHMASMRKISTCPLCKSSFASITRVEGAATYDQRIYSQTIPDADSGMNICIIPNQERLQSVAEASSGPVCVRCRSQEPVELLIRCHLCQIRSIHNYCLDPPLMPWTCIHCMDLQSLYHRRW